MARGRNGTGEMRADANGLRLPDYRDLGHLGDASDIRHSGADIVDLHVLYQRREMPPQSPFLAVG